MSDSRDLHAPAGVDKRAEMRELAPGVNRNIPSASEQVSGSAGTDSAISSKKLRVRIDPAHPIGDAPRESAPPAEVSGGPAVAGENREVVRDSSDGEFSAEAAIAAAASAFPEIDASSEVFSVEKLQQLRLQFEQLAGHLRSQQYQLDRREAQLHSQLAQQENEVRTSRLWFREHQQELADREAELLRREQEMESQRAGLIENLGQREAELARREVAFELQSALWANERDEWADAIARSEAECREVKRQWQEQADALAVRHQDLEQQRQALLQPSDTTANAAATALVSEQAAAERTEEQSRVAGQLHADAEQFYRQVDSTLDLMRQFLIGQQPNAGVVKSVPKDSIGNEPGSRGLPPEMASVFGEFRTALARFHGRQKNLEEAEALLTDGQTALDRGRQQLTADRQTWQEQCEIDRRRINDDRRRAEADMDRKLQTLTSRGEHLERRTAAVDQLRAEVLRAQRETLELRLATDEIWSQLSQSVPPPALTQSLARIRGKLAEQFQLERVELADQEKQLEALAVRLESQHDKLHHQKEALEQWVADRRNEIEGQASRLVAQEMELARRQGELEELNERTQSERRLYEGEIRRLLGELRRSGIAATAAAA